MAQQRKKLRGGSDYESDLPEADVERGKQDHGRQNTGVEVRAGTGQLERATSDSEVLSAGSDGLVVMSPEEPTVMSVGNVGPTRLIEEMSEQEDGLTSNTHFQTVTDAKTSSGVFANRNIWMEQSLAGWAKIIAMIATLVFGCLLFLWAMRTPSADELYMEALAGNTTSIPVFLQMYPDDPRVTEVEDLQMSVKLRGVLKRLSAQNSLGITKLLPSEESFMLAMEGTRVRAHASCGAT